MRGSLMSSIAARSPSRPRPLSLTPPYDCRPTTTIRQDRKREKRERERENLTVNAKRRNVVEHDAADLGLLKRQLGLVPVRCEHAHCRPTTERRRTIEPKLLHKQTPMRTTDAEGQTLNCWRCAARRQTRRTASASSRVRTLPRTSAAATCQRSAIVSDLFVY